MNRLGGLDVLSEFVKPSCDAHEHDDGESSMEECQKLQIIRYCRK